jgi:hypothetical protein
MAETAALGCQVDKEGHDMGELHPVAEVVHDLVVHRGERLVIDFAKLRTTPRGGSIIAKLGPAWKDEPAHDHRGKPRPGSFAVKYDRVRQP